jgi:PAS domain S-box-containing protein
MTLSRSPSWGFGNELLQQLVDAAPTALIVLDLELMVLGMNQEACDLLGQTRLDLLGRPVHSAWASERFRAAIADLLENATRGHAQVAVEGPVAAAQAERWTRWTASRLVDGETVRLLLVGRDVTELRSLEQRRSADDALSRIVASCDSIDRAIPRLLRALCRALGWDVGELWTVDTVAGVLRCDGIWAVADLDAAQLADSCRAVTLGLGEGLPGAAWARGRVTQLSSLTERPPIRRAGVDTALAFPIRGRDEIFGVVTLSSRRTRVVDAAMHEALESLGGQIGLLFDRIRARENLRRTETALRAIHRIGTKSDATLERKLEELLREGCRWFEMDAGALARSDCTEIIGVVSTDHRPSKAARGGKREGRSTSFESQWCREVMLRGECLCIEDLAEPSVSEPGRAWQAFIGSPVRVRGGSLGAIGFWSTHPRRRGFTATDREILAVMAQWVAAELERARLQEQLVNGERLAAIGMTATTFAHEVSNPLSNMALACELVAREVGDPVGGGDAVLQLVKKEVGRLGRLLDEFRALSRVQSLNLESACLWELVESVLTDFGPMLRARGVTCRLDGAPNVECSIDRDKMRQVLVNLVKNALEAMSDGGVLTVAVECDDAGVRLEISDTGCGVPDGVDVFAPFATTKREGTGLGLAVARQLVVAHHGRVSFDSKPGYGTSFMVELPRSRSRTRDDVAHASLSCT